MASQDKIEDLLIVENPLKIFLLVIYLGKDVLDSKVFVYILLSVI